MSRIGSDRVDEQYHDGGGTNLRRRCYVQPVCLVTSDRTNNRYARGPLPPAAMARCASGILQQVSVIFAAEDAAAAEEEGYSRRGRDSDSGRCSNARLPTELHVVAVHSARGTTVFDSVCQPRGGVVR